MLAFERLGRVTGDRIEAPSFLARFSIIGSQISARDIFRTCAANQDLAFDNPRGARDRHMRPLWDGQLAPDDLAIVCVERDQSPVKCGDIDLALIDSDAAIDSVTTDIDQF